MRWPTPRRGQDSEMADELGDLLLQVVLHAPLAAERRAFDLATIAEGISAKLVRRHPHVFGGEPRSWEEIKAEEQAARGDNTTSLSAKLERKVRSLGALDGAMTISRSRTWLRVGRSRWGGEGARGAR